MAKIRNDGGRSRLTLADPAELLAAIPSMFGFRPAESVVVLELGPDGKQIGRTVRADLPPPEAVDAAVEHIVGSMAAGEPPPAAIIAVIGGGEPTHGGRPPQAALVRKLKHELNSLGVVVPAEYWVAEMSGGSLWTCYDKRRCCRGSMPDPSTSVLAAEMTALGRVTFESRAEVERLFTPDDQALLDTRAELIDAKVDVIRENGWPTERLAEAVRAGLRASTTGVLALSDELIADLAVALTDPRIRDACMATAVPPDSPLAAAAARLWQALTRALPAPERADAAALAAFGAYQEGDGATAGIALTIALEADPAHLLAQLLSAALSSGLHPQQLRELAEHDELGLCAQLRAAA